MKASVIRRAACGVCISIAGAGLVQAKAVSEETALRTCQKALKAAARDPETAVVPDVGAMRGGADRRYLWNPNSRLIRMRNGLGVEVSATALCVVDEDTGKIKLLTLDGKRVPA